MSSQKLRGSSSSDLRLVPVSPEGRMVVRASRSTGTPTGAGWSTGLSDSLLSNDQGVGARPSGGCRCGGVGDRLTAGSRVALRPSLGAK